MNNKFAQSMQEIESADIPGAADVFGLNDLPPARQPREVVVYQENPNAMLKREDGTLVYKGVELTKWGMTLPPDTDETVWGEVGEFLQRTENAVSWWAGDWAQYAREKWQWEYTDIGAYLGYTGETIESYASICRAVPVRLISNQPVVFSIAREVMTLKGVPDLQTAWLHYSVHFGLRVEDFKTDFRLLKYQPDSLQFDWINRAFEDGRRLSTYDEFNQSKPKPRTIIPASDQKSIRRLLALDSAALANLTPAKRKATIQAARDMQRVASDILRKLEEG